MFGYLTAASGILDAAERKRYTEVYCGLCRSLERCFGQAARLTLNYDMCFLVLLLSSLYEPEEESGARPCIRHPFEDRSFICSSASDYTACMNVALAYHKCLDDWQDDRRLSALAESRVLRPDYEKIKADYPRQCACMEEALHELAALEREGLEEPDAAAACSGKLMREIFVWKEDRWADILRRMADAIGRTVYLMDAIRDLEDDVQRGRYNPFRSFAGDPDNADRFRDILRMHLGECIYWFDKLPLVADAGLMRNILCIGLWSAFHQKYSREEPDHGSGSL